jgi:hypothetical protein
MPDSFILSKLFNSRIEMQYDKILIALLVGAVSTYYLYSKDTSNKENRESAMYVFFCFIVSIVAYISVWTFMSDNIVGQNKSFKMKNGENMMFREMRTGEPEF